MNGWKLCGRARGVIPCYEFTPRDGRVIIRWAEENKNSSSRRMTKNQFHMFTLVEVIKRLIGINFSL